MKTLQRFAGLGGLSLLVALIVYQGAGTVADTVLSVGWGIAVVSLFHLVPLTGTTLAWREVSRSSWRGGPAVFLWARIVREAVNDLLPVAQIGGNVAGARILTFHGARARVAGAGVVVDLTLELITQLAFTAIGLGLLVALGGGDDAVRWGLAGLVVAVLAVVGFVLAQRWGLFKLLERLLVRLAGRFDWPALGSLENFHDTMIAMYRDRGAISRATAFHLVAWVVGSGEVWLAAHFIGVALTPVEAVIIESLGQAIRSAGFLVPGAIGVQEGGYLVVGAIFGVPPEVGIGISLIKRVRDLTWGLPAMLGWQWIEGRRLGRGGVAGE